MIARAHAKAHKTNLQLRKHSTPDDLSAVDDFSREVGLLAKELDGFMPAFEHAQMDAGGDWMLPRVSGGEQSWDGNTRFFIKNSYEMNSWLRLY